MMQDDREIAEGRSEAEPLGDAGKQALRDDIDARLAARAPAAENLGENFRFTPGVPVFVNGKYQGISRDISTAWGIAERRVSALLEWHPLAYRIEYIHQCVADGSLLMPVFIRDDSEHSPDVGLIDVGRGVDGQPFITALLHIFDPMDLAALSQIIEAIAIVADASAVGIWTLVECPLLPGYSRLTHGKYSHWQLMPVKPIH